MAAQLKDGGFYPAVQKLERGEFVRFAQSCQAPPSPSPALKALKEKMGARK